MKQNNDIEPCQGYRGWADVEAIEYKYPRIKPLKYVYMEGTEIYDEPVEDVGGIHGYKEMLRVIKEDPNGDEAWEYYTWLGSKWNERFFPAIDTAIALNELNYK